MVGYCCSVQVLRRSRIITPKGHNADAYACDHCIALQHCRLILADLCRQLDSRAVRFAARCESLVHKGSSANPSGTSSMQPDGSQGAVDSRTLKIPLAVLGLHASVFDIELFDQAAESDETVRALQLLLSFLVVQRLLHVCMVAY